MARDAEIKRKELEEEERKADEAKKALEEAEKEVLKRQKADEEAALRRAIEARDVAKVRWARIWPRLQILRALNGINGELVAKATEEARKAREEEERAKRFEEDQAKKAAYCKQLLKDGLAAAADEGNLERAIKTTDLTVVQTTIMDNDEELRDLHIKARNELETIQKEAESKRAKETGEKEAEEKRQEEKRIAKAQIKDEKELADAQRLEAIQREKESEEKKQEEERIAEAKRKEEEEKEAEENRQEKKKIAEAKKIEDEELAEALLLEAIQREKEAEEKKQDEERTAEAKIKEEEALAEAKRLEAIQREKEAEEKREEDERIAEAKIKEDERLAGLAKLANIKASIQTAISEKDIEKLKKSIAEVKDNNLEDDFADFHKQATAMLERLQKIEKIKKNIQELKRPLIAELKSMSSPPVDVHRSMTAAFILMGENREDLRDWNNIAILLGKTGQESVKRKVQGLKVEDVTEEMAAKAEKQILGLTSDEVYEANQAASLFYDWADMICFDKKQVD
ncbi:calponin homology domain-containing protein DDB_G0272472-like [Bolinopsis microptera]|uniref:calponin homology domain-containing protein DDB_G0272472-like n=1 Tax=Bolinopsis microptera TaxID=2820187 RepID=UPI003079DB0F